MSAAGKRLAAALIRATQGGDAAKLVSIARRARVHGRLARRAAKNIAINVDAYLKLCAAIGLDPLLGEADRVAEPGPIPVGFDWTMLALALKGQRMLRAQTVAQAKKSIGGISDATISRVENGHECSVDHLLSICEYISQHPYRLCRFHGEHGVKDVAPKRETAIA